MPDPSCRTDHELDRLGPEADHPSFAPMGLCESELSAPVAERIGQPFTGCAASFRTPQWECRRPYVVTKEQQLRSQLLSNSCAQQFPAQSRVQCAPDRSIPLCSGLDSEAAGASVGASSVFVSEDSRRLDPTFAQPPLSEVNCGL